MLTLVIVLYVVAWCLVTQGFNAHTEGRKQQGVALIALGWGVWLGACIIGYVT